MFGNKYAGENIAAEMFNILYKSNSHSKTASKVENSTLKAEAVAKPEDFLVPPETSSEDVGASLDSKISNISSLGDDSCSTHNMAYDDCKEQHSKADDSAGMLIADSFAVDSTPEDVSYLVDARAKLVLEGLGKIAKSLKNKNENFAADLVEATAMGIKKDYLVKASKKIHIINSLNKMASNFYSDGNNLAGDMVSVTIEKIKKSS